jgi:hypothetical protein
MVEMDKDALQKLSVGMKQNSSLVCLDLSYNDISDSSGIIVA